MEPSSFRLFLGDFVKAGKDLAEKSKEAPKPRRLKSRRVYDRFDLSYKHMTLLNDQDILIVRDVSEEGFSCEVAKRAFDKFELGACYQASVRYAGEIFKANLLVSWKEKSFVGFECVHPSVSLKLFMSRLLRPMTIGLSMKRVLEEGDRVLFEGSEDAKLAVFCASKEELASFRLDDRYSIAEWVRDVGFRFEGEKFQQAEHKNFILDVIMAMNDPLKDLLLQAFE